MATLTQHYKPNAMGIVFVRKHDALIDKLMSRRCIVVSVGLILTGIGIPALMVFKLLPVSLFPGFVGFALLAVGGVLALVYFVELWDGRYPAALNGNRAASVITRGGTHERLL